MNKEIIAVSPVYDKTPYRVKEMQAHRKAKKLEKSKGLLRYLGIICLLNVIMCGFFFFESEGISVKSAYINLTESMLGGISIENKYTNGPAELDHPTSDYIPTAADPTATDSTSDDSAALETLKAYLNLYEFDYSKVPEGLYPIIPYDLSSEADGELKLYNDTSLSINVNAYAENQIIQEGITDITDPLVLIVHTHGTEAYSEEGVIGYSDTYNIPRSYDVTKNVIHIGRVMMDVLNANEVPTVQCDVMHDAEGYLGAYGRSAETIKEYLERYPTIKYVFDVHRDSVLMEDKTKTRPITLVNGEIAAQVMTVIGTDELGCYHPDWENNLTLAAKLQKELNTSYLGLARSICLRGSSYNQELSPYALLLEVGSCGNTLKEAEVSAEILATKLAKLIKEGW